jgi:hypothetical protein
VLQRRIGIGAYLLIDGLLVVLQVAVLASALPDPAKAVLAILIQIVKVVPTVWRLDDLGRSPDDALWTLIPVANVVLFFLCTQGTPTDPRREKLRSTWAGQLSAFAALGRAIPLMARTAAVGLPIAAVYAVISAIVGRWVVWQLGTLESMSADAHASLQTALWAFCAFLALYTVVQLTKLGSASRLSWVPSLLLAPTAIVALIVTFIDQSKLGMGLAFMVFLQQAWSLLWMTFGGAATAIGWIRTADAALDGKSVPAGQVFEEIGRRTIEVSAPHGTRVQAIAIGMQVLIPGVFYWLQLAFTDMIAVLHPEEAALSGSGRLTWGMRGRLFKVMLFSSLVGLGIAGGIALAMGQAPADAAMALLGLADPREPTNAQYIAQESWFALESWWQALALLLLYRERLARRAQREAAAMAPVQVAV